MGRVDHCPFVACPLSSCTPDTSHHGSSGKRCLLHLLLQLLKIGLSSLTARFTDLSAVIACCNFMKSTIGNKSSLRDRKAFITAILLFPLAGQSLSIQDKRCNPTIRHRSPDILLYTLINKLSTIVSGSSGQRLRKRCEIFL